MNMTCDLRSVYSCFSPISDLYRLRDSLLFYDISDANLDAICGEYEHVEECVQKSVNLCPTQHKLTLLSRTQVLRYLCTTGYEGYKKVRPCLRNKNLLDQVRECNSTFTGGMAEIQSMRTHTLTQKTEHICRCLNSLLSCIRDYTSDVCGTQAADWIHSMKSRMISPTMTEIGCSTTHSSKDYLPTIIAVLFAVLVSFVVISLTGVIIYKKVKSEDIKQRRKSDCLLQESREKDKTRASSSSTVTTKTSTTGGEKLTEEDESEERKLLDNKLDNNLNMEKNIIVDQV